MFPNTKAPITIVPKSCWGIELILFGGQLIKHFQNTINICHTFYYSFNSFRSMELDPQFDKTFNKALGNDFKLESY